MKFKTQVGPLVWTYVSGKGSAKYGKQFTSEDPFDFEYKASMKVDKASGDKIQKVINDFWKENKPAKILKPTSTFLKPEMVESDKTDEYGANVKVESGNYIISASTNAAFKTKDGVKPAKIALLNSKGQKLPDSHPLVSGDVGVGEGSTGVIHGNLAITEYEGKAYVKFYLGGVQFAKLVPYEGNDIDADALDIEEDDGCGIETDGCDVENIAGPAL